MINQGDIQGLKQIEAAVPKPADELDVEEMMDEGQLPNKNFIGWAPGVDLNAMKVKAAEDAGINPYELGLWAEDIRNAEQGVTLQVPEKEQPRNLTAIQNQIKGILKKHGVNPNSFIIAESGGNGSFTISITDDSKKDAHRILKQQGYVNA